MNTGDVFIGIGAGVTIILALVAAYATPYRAFLDWFYDRNWSAIRAAATIIFTLFNLGLIVWIIIIIRRFSRLFREPPKAAPAGALVPDTPKEEVRDSWELIRKLANSDNPSDWNSAVLRADALLNDILADLGYEGETFADRLKIADPTILKSLDRVWSAHRLRNLIAHEPLEQHSRETILEALRSYEQALKELGMFEKKSPPSGASQI